MEIILLIDGENLKGKIRSVFKEENKNKPIWHEYNFNGLLNKALNGTAIKRKVNCVYLGFETQPNKGLSYTTNKTILNLISH